MRPPELVERRAGAIADIELVAEDDSFDDSIAIRCEVDPEISDRRLGREAEGFSLKVQGTIGGKTPEGDSTRSHQPGDGFGQVAEERRQLHLRLEVGGDGLQRDGCGGLRVLRSLPRVHALPRPEPAGGSQPAGLTQARRTRLPVAVRQGGYNLHVAPPTSLRLKSNRVGEGRVTVQVR